MGIEGRDDSSSRFKASERLGDRGALDRVVTELCALQRRGGIERTLAVGELVLSQFFGGDAAAWRDRRRNKNNSVRRLASRPDCPFSRSALNEAVAVYVATLSLPCVRTFGHIGSSHVTAVLGLPELAREQMLNQAERERMSVRELRTRIVSMRRTAGERRGRPGHDGNPAVSSFRAAARDAQQGMKRLRDQPELPLESREELRRCVAELNRLLAEAEEFVQGKAAIVSARARSPQAQSA